MHLTLLVHTQDQYYNHLLPSQQSIVILEHEPRSRRLPCKTSNYSFLTLNRGNPLAMLGDSTSERWNAVALTSVCLVNPLVASAGALVSFFWVITIGTNDSASINKRESWILHTLFYLSQVCFEATV